MRIFGASLLAGACLLAAASTASADGVRLSDQQLDTVTAGFLGNSFNLLNDAAITTSTNLFVALDLGDDDVQNNSPLFDPNLQPVGVPLFFVATGQVSFVSFFEQGFGN